MPTKLHSVRAALKQHFSDNNKRLTVTRTESGFGLRMDVYLDDGRRFRSRPHPDKATPEIQTALGPLGIQVARVLLIDTEEGRNGRHVYTVYVAEESPCA